MSMENTRKFRFEDNSPHWYLAMGDHHVGPMSAADIYQKVLDGEITLAHYVWKPGKSGWERMCDLPEFQVAVPALPISPPALPASSKKKGPPASPKKRAGTPPPPRDDEEKPWYLHYNETQYGPFSSGEILRYIELGKVHARVHAWCDGMEDWKRLGEIDEFEEAAAAGKKSGGSSRAAGGSKEKRSSPRRPMVARILVADTSTVTAAVCRDVSIGGMQVLTDQPPGSVGAKIRMNVSPTTDRKPDFAPFVAEGVVVRLLEDGRGFSFRFTKLSEQAKASIEDYIRRAG